MTRNRPRDESPWYCPTCRAWLGWKLDTCFECGADRPRLALRSDDVAVDDARRVMTRHRIRGKINSVQQYLTDWVANR